eukprot:jgi/Mesen1/6771/ME000348S06050
MAYRLIAQSSIGRADSTASLTQLELEESSEEGPPVVKLVAVAPEPVQGAAMLATAGSLPGLDLKIQTELNGALDSVMKVVREALLSKEAARAEADTWRRKWEELYRATATAHTLTGPATSVGGAARGVQLSEGGGVSRGRDQRELTSAQIEEQSRSRRKEGSSSSSSSSSSASSSSVSGGQKSAAARPGGGGAGAGPGAGGAGGSKPAGSAERAKTAESSHRAESAGSGAEP